MSKEIMVKLTDAELEAVCGGNFSAKDEAKKAAIDEAIKFGIGIVAVPVGAGLSRLAVWFVDRLTKKLDTMIDESK